MTGRRLVAGQAVCQGVMVHGNHLPIGGVMAQRAGAWVVRRGQLFFMTGQAICQFVMAKGDKLPV